MTFSAPRLRLPALVCAGFLVALGAIRTHAWSRTRAELFRVLRVDPATGTASVFMTIPDSGAGLNALTFDSSGNVYVSDSFLGKIWKTGAGGGVATAWVTHPLLATTGVPPFGANGLAFNKN